MIPGPTPSQDDALARAWRALADAPDEPDAYAALRRQLARHQVDPDLAFARGLRELPGAGRPREDHVHRLCRSVGLGFGDPRLRWPRRIRGLVARPDGPGALAEDERGAPLWVDAGSLMLRELEHPRLVGDQEVARGLDPDGRPWVARRGAPPGDPSASLLRVSCWDPGRTEDPEVVDVDLGPTLGEPTPVWGLPEGPRVLARLPTGEVHLLGPALDRPLPALARGFGRGFVGLPDGGLLGPVRDDADVMRLARLEVATGQVTSWGPALDPGDRFQVAPDGARLALYRRETRGASVQVLGIPGWEPEMHAPLVEGFLGWSATGVLILGPCATGHLGRWAPGQAGATRFAAPPPESAARYALLREAPPELLLLEGGRLVLHDLAQGRRTGPGRGPFQLAVGRATCSRVGPTRRTTWAPTSGAPEAPQDLPDAVPWVLDDGLVAHETATHLVIRGAVRRDHDLREARLVAASGGDPLVLVVRTADRLPELHRVELATGATAVTPLRVDPDRLQGGGVWVPGELAWVLVAPVRELFPDVILFLERRRLGDGARPPGDPAEDLDLALRVRARRSDHFGLRNPPRRAPDQAWLWLPDETETRAVTPQLEVVRRLGHSPAEGGPMALSPSGARLARALPARVQVWDTATGEPRESFPTLVAADDLAFLGEDELLVLAGDRVRARRLG